MGELAEAGLGESGRRGRQVRRGGASDEAGYGGGVILTVRSRRSFCFMLQRCFE